METLADSKFLNVCEVIDHFINSSKEWNLLGLFFTIYSIKGRASKAVPSTTSITINPFGIKKY